jgi:hypothetical protein
MGLRPTVTLFPENIQEFTKSRGESPLFCIRLPLLFQGAKTNGTYTVYGATRETGQKYAWLWIFPCTARGVQ